MRVLIRVYCDKNYYTKDCNTYCVEHNDKTNGHYTCDRSNGNKICKSGWTGKDCKTGMYRYTVIC